MRNIIATFIFCLFVTAGAAQPFLFPSIGLGQEPEGSEPICPITTYLGDFESSGIQEGDTCADFTLFDIDGNSFTLSDALTEGKPVLMVAGSYTCPVFRNKLATIEQVRSDYPNDLTVIIVYGVEAHPYGDISPYFGIENPGQANLNQGILYPQPTTYQERMDIAQDMFDDMGSDPSIVFFDGPCQEWWEYYGPAPQNSYLIDTTGIVVSKHGWFDKFPDNIECDLLEYFGLPSNGCGDLVSGTFEFELIDSSAFGEPGLTHYGYANLINNSDDDVLVEIVRMQEIIPNDWSTSMCVTACLASMVDTDTVLIPMDSTQLFSIDFHTSLIPGQGQVRMGFRNVNQPSNNKVQWFSAETSPSSVNNPSAEKLALYPNPTTGLLNLNINVVPDAQLTVSDLNGNSVYNTSSSGRSIDLSHLEDGVYSVTLVDGENYWTTSRIVLIH